MSRSNFSFRGLMAPVFTPFHENKDVNFEIIPQYAEYLHLKGIKGILVNGTTGEGVSLTVDERKAVLEAWVAACRPYGQTIMAQIGGTNARDVQNLARHAEEAKVSSILCLADLFFRPSTVDDLVRYLEGVSAAAPATPLLYYHIPSFTGIQVNPRQLLERSEEIPTLAGIKFTDVDLVAGTSCASYAPERLSVFLGCDSLLLPALVQGFDSAIGTTINMFPEENNAIVSLFQEGEIQRAAESQKILNRNIQEITKLGSWVSSMKAAMKFVTGIEVGPVREPLLEVNIKPDQVFPRFRL